MANLAMHQEVETIRTLKGKPGDRRLAVRRRRRLTRRAVPSLRESRSHEGPTIEKGLECNNDIRNRDTRRQLDQRKETTSCRIFRKTVEPEIEKRTIGSSTGLREMSGWTLWTGRPPPKRKNRRPKHSPRKSTNGGMLGTNSLKEGALLSAVVACMEGLYTGFGLVIGFIAHFNTARDYNTHNRADSSVLHVGCFS
jgi:hypothetical protein